MAAAPVFAAEVLEVLVKLFDNFGVCLDDVLRLTDVVVEVIQLRGASFVCVELPFAGPNGQERLIAVVKESVVRRLPRRPEAATAEN